MKKKTIKIRQLKKNMKGKQDPLLIWIEKNQIDLGYKTNAVKLVRELR